MAEITPTGVRYSNTNNALYSAGTATTLLRDNSAGDTTTSQSVSANAPNGTSGVTCYISLILDLGSSQYIDTLRFVRDHSAGAVGGTVGTAGDFVVSGSISLSTSDDDVTYTPQSGFSNPSFTFIGSSYQTGSLDNTITLGLTARYVRIVLSTTNNPPASPNSLFRTASARGFDLRTYGPSGGGTVSQTGAGTDAVSALAVSGIGEITPGAEGLSLTATPPSRAESGLGTDAVAAVNAPTMSERAPGTESLGANTALPALGETGLGTDAASPSQRPSMGETGLGTDAASLGAAYTAGDTGFGADNVSSQPLFVAAQPVWGQPFPPSEQVTRAAAVDVAEGSPGSDAIGPGRTLDEPTPGSDAVSASAAVPAVAEVAPGSDALVRGAIPADAAPGADAVAASFTVTAGESGSGTDAASLAAGITRAETVPGADAASMATSVTRAEAAPGADAASMATSVTFPESGLGTDTASAPASVGVAEGVPGTDARSGIASVGVAEGSLGSDAVTAALAPSVAEGVPGSDAVSANAALPVGDGSPTDGVGVGVLRPEGLPGTDAVGANASVTAADTAPGSDDAAVGLPAIAESAPGSDAVSVAAAYSPGEGSPAEAITVSPAYTLAETAPGADAISVSIGYAVGETGFGADAVGADAVLSVAEPAFSPETIEGGSNAVSVDLGEGAPGTDLVIFYPLASIGETGLGTDAVSVNEALSPGERGLPPEVLVIDAVLSVAESAPGLDAVIGGESDNNIAVHEGPPGSCTCCQCLYVRSLQASGQGAGETGLGAQAIIVRNPPNPVQNLAASNRSDGVTVTWDAPVDPGRVDHYIVERIGASSVTVTSPRSLIVTGLTIGQRYTFAVYAVTSDGIAASPEFVGITFQPAIPLSVPAITSVDSASGGFTGNWVEPVGLAVGQSVVSYDVALMRWDATSAGVYDTTTDDAYVFEGLLGLTTYQFSVRARDNYGNLSAWAAMVPVVTATRGEFDMTAATLAEFTDLLAKAYLQIVGDGNHYGGGLGPTSDIGDDYGVCKTLRNLQSAILATEERPVVQTLLQAVYTAQDAVKNTALARTLLGSSVRALDSMAYQLGITGVSSMESLLAYYNTGVGGPWESLVAPDFATLYYLVSGRNFTATSIYAPTDVALASRVVGSAMVAGTAVDSALYAGGGSSAAVITGFAGSSGTLTVVGTARDSATASVQSSRTFTCTVTGNGTFTLTPNVAGDLLLSVTSLTLPGGMSGGTASIVAKAPTGRTTPVP